MEYRKEKQFFNEVDLHNITEFFASEVNYEQIIDLCPNITTIELDLRGKNLSMFQKLRN